ncbi:DUF4829 domain-containing protein [Clostridium tertium]|nr:DUF4829 domain-containing protein [Clostridium tertium]MDB1924355.1 DUF4829 domain-containing protein [Clostridium tertium]MDB1927997.1 DUF4829 domain-containing protein [Clostridium tertium]MDB1931226.1 DUF4829 domain-containing protein [Clostridium tertium]
MELIYMELVNDESIYNVYMHSGKGSLRNDLSRDDIRIYNVKYYIKYKDDNKTVSGSGEYTKKYFLIKESNTGKWKIYNIGEEYFIYSNTICKYQQIVSLLKLF